MASYTFEYILYQDIDKIKEIINNKFSDIKIIFITININQNNSKYGELKVLFDKSLSEYRELELYNLLNDTYVSL